MSKENQCPRVDELSAWLTGVLPRELASAIERHVMECEPCSADALACISNVDDAKQASGMQETLASVRQRAREMTVSQRNNTSSAVYGDVRAPVMLDHFRIGELIGEGGMGRVYAAVDERLCRDVAIKVLRPVDAMDDRRRARFLSEARAIAKLHHDLIVPIYHVGMFDDQPYFVMPHLRGETLQARLQHGAAMPISEVIRLATDVAKGLAVVHAAGMIHRDVKPGNVFLIGEEARVCLLDFGIAKASDDGSDLTATGVPIGTPRYMSPEQSLGKELTAQSDLFSLGVMIHESVTGRCPFQRPTATATLVAIASEPVRPLVEIDGRVPKSLSDLVEELLRKDPNQRPASAGVVASRLSAIAKSVESQPSLQRSTRAGRWVASVLLVLASLAAAGVWTSGVLRSGKRAEASLQTKVSSALSELSAVSASTQSTVESYMSAGPGETELRELFVATESQLRDAFRTWDQLPVMAKSGEALSSTATVQYPASIQGVRSWSIELRSHYGDVSQVLPHPKLPTFATGNHGCDVRLWNEEGTLNNILIGDPGTSQGNHSFSPCGRYLATKNMGNAGIILPSLRIWNVSDGRCIVHVRLTAWAWSLAWSTDGRYLALDAGSGVIRVLSLADGGEMLLQCEPLKIGKFAWSPDSRYLVTKSTLGPAIYDVRTGMHLTTLRPGEFEGGEYISHFVSFSPDGRLLAGYAGPIVFLWDFASQEYLGHIDTAIPIITSLAWHRHRNEFLVSGLGDDGLVYKGVERYNASTRQLISRREFDREVALVSFVGDGDEIIAGHDQAVVSLTDEADATAFENGAFPGRYHSYATWVTDQGERLICGDRLFDLKTGEFVSEIEQPPGELVWADPNGEWAAYECPDNRLCVLAFGDSPESTRYWDIEGPSVFYRSDRDGKRLLRRRHQAFDVFTLDKATEAVALEHPVEVLCAEFSPDGRQVVTLAADNLLRFWDLETGKLSREQTLPEDREDFASIASWGTSLLSWSKGGQAVYYSANTSVHRLDLETWESEQLTEIPPPVRVRGINMSPSEESYVITTSAWLMMLVTKAGNVMPQHSKIGELFQWSAEGKHFVSVGPIGHRSKMGVLAFESDTCRRSGSLFGHLEGGHWLCIGPTGHYRGSPGVESQFVYVALLEDGSNRTFEPSAFQRQFKWTNDPSQATFCSP